jgi:hypothetical protein
MVVTGLVVVVVVVILHTPAMGDEVVEVEEVVQIQVKYLEKEVELVTLRVVMGIMRLR